MAKPRDLANSVNSGSIPASRLSGAQTGSAPAYAARAWVLFDGTKDTTGSVSTANTNRQILASGNVTSVLRNGTGDYTITFTTAMADANYCAVKSVEVSSGFGYEIFDQVKTTTTLRLGSGKDTASATFDAKMNVVVFR